MNDYFTYAPDLLELFEKNTLTPYLQLLGSNASLNLWSTLDKTVLENMYFVSNSIWDTSSTSFQTKNKIKTWKKAFHQAPLYALSPLNHLAHMHLSKTPYPPESAHYRTQEHQLQKHLPPSVMCAQGFFIHFQGLSPTPIFLGNIFSLPVSTLQSFLDSSEHTQSAQSFEQLLTQNQCCVLPSDILPPDLPALQPLMSKIHLCAPFPTEQGAYFLLHTDPQTSWICPKEHLLLEPEPPLLSFFPPSAPPEDRLDPLFFLTHTETSTLFRLILNTPIEVLFSLQERQDLEETLPQRQIHAGLRKTL